VFPALFLIVPGRRLNKTFALRDLGAGRTNLPCQRTHFHPHRPSDPSASVKVTMAPHSSESCPSVGKLIVFFSLPLREKPCLTVVSFFQTPIRHAKFRSPFLSPYRTSPSTCCMKISVFFRYLHSPKSFSARSAMLVGKLKSCREVNSRHILFPVLRSVRLGSSSLVVPVETVAWPRLHRPARGRILVSVCFPDGNVPFFSFKRSRPTPPPKVGSLLLSFFSLPADFVTNHRCFLRAQCRRGFSP